ncbi:IS1595 family transposase [Massilia sp. PWRC2]|uniref:IS1595 family transposase n=1 Tax=Massilia sp. PWRC2 TaxID=2804626 RepID=UPI003CF42742
MDASAFSRFVTQIAQLSRSQCAQVLALLQPVVNQGQVVDLIEKAVANKLCCPRCQGNSLYRHGAKHGLQRFRCRACGRTFNSLTGTPLARLRHKHKWLAYADCMLDSGTVRKAASIVEVAKNTSMRWRHRFLARTKDDRPVCLSGIAEADETFLLESQKGARELPRPPRKQGGRASKRGISHEHVCILAGRDRSGATLDFVTGRGAVTASQLRQYLQPVLARDALLVTDGHHAYRSFARRAGISHEYVSQRAGERVRGAIHVQNVSAYHRRFHTWLNGFHGVATRYLPNYLGWRWAIDQQRIDSPAALLRAAIGVFHT